MKSIIFLLFLWATILSSSCGEQKQQKIIIATASNLQFVMDTLITIFEQKNNVKCELIIGSSGKMTAQITEGAPYDIFISADEKYTQSIFDKNLTNDTPKIFAYAQLIMWSLTAYDSFSLDILKKNTISHIALANPKTAPFGVATMEVLQNDNEFFSQIQQKLTFGESVAQADQFVISGGAQIGFTSKSLVLSNQIKSKTYWLEIADSLYRPIEQTVIVLNSHKQTVDIANQFKQFLFSPEAKNILKLNGYKVDE